MMECKIVIRTIEAADIDQTQRFLLSHCQELYGTVSIRQRQDIENLAERYISPERNTFLGAFTLDGALIGTIAVTGYDDRIAALKGRYSLPTTAEIGRFYIEQQIRRQGIGSGLLEKILEFCCRHDYTSIYLHTHRYLPGGFNFWQKQGFRIVLDEGGSDQIVHMEKCL